MAPDPFATVMGTTRGAEYPDALDAQQPSEQAREQFQRMTAGLFSGDSDPHMQGAFSVLAEHLDSVTRPLLSELLDATVSGLLRSAQARNAQSTAYFFHITGIRAALSDDLRVDLSEHTGAGRLHVRDVAAAVCGPDISGMGAAPRGSWTHPGDFDVDRCPECERRLRRPLPVACTEEHFDELWPNTGGPLRAAQVRAHAAQTLLELLRAGSALDVKPVRRALAGIYNQSLPDSLRDELRAADADGQLLNAEQLAQLSAAHPNADSRLAALSSEQCFALWRVIAERGEELGCTPWRPDGHARSALGDALLAELI